MLVVTIMGTEFLGRNLMLQFGFWAINIWVDTGLYASTCTV